MKEKIFYSKEVKHYEGLGIREGASCIVRLTNYELQFCDIKKRPILKINLKDISNVAIISDKELIEKLYTAFLENPEIQSIITDLISISETFSHLDDKDFRNVIQENINKIIQCQKDEEKEKMRHLYKSANDNETEALKIQIQLRDKINNRLKLEKMND